MIQCFDIKTFSFIIRQELAKSLPLLQQFLPPHLFCVLVIHIIFSHFAHLSLIKLIWQVRKTWPQMIGKQEGLPDCSQTGSQQAFLFLLFSKPLSLKSNRHIEEFEQGYIVFTCSLRLYVRCPFRTQVILALHNLDLSKYYLLVILPKPCSAINLFQLTKQVLLCFPLSLLLLPSICPVIFQALFPNFVPQIFQLCLDVKYVSFFCFHFL